MKHRGQSMTEYAFAGVLVVCVCIGVLVLAGGNLLVFGKKYSEEVYKATGDDVSFFGQKSGLASAKAGKGINGLVPPPKKGETQVCMKGGYCVNLPTAMTSNLNSETIGGNGNDLTLAMAGVLAQIAAQMAADPNADPYLKDVITRMANQGHGLGNAEKLVENHPWVKEQLRLGRPINITANEEDYVNMEHSADVMVDQVSGINANMNIVNANRNAFLGIYGEYLDYVNANPSAMPKGLDVIVRVQAHDIDAIAGTAFGSGQWVDTEQLAQMIDGTAAETTDGDMGYNKIKAADPSVITHQDSNTICSTKGAGCYQNP